MRIFFAFLIAPMLALADQSVSYVFAGWACAHQQQALPHAVHAVFLAATLVATLFAWTTARAALPTMREEAGFSVHRHDMMAACAVAIGALSTAVIVALWIPQWVLSPCFG